MENKAHALMAGIFTIVLVVAGALIALWFNRDRVERVPYEIATTLSIPGLNPQASVRYRGLDVGRVDKVLFDSEKAGRILIRFSVAKNTPITHSTFATLGYQGVTGIAYVQLDDNGENPTLLPSSKKHLARIELRPGLLDKLQIRGLAIMEQTEEVMTRMNTLLSDNNQKSILKAFTDVSAAAAQMKTAVDQLTPALKKLPPLADQANRTLASFDKLSGNLNALTLRLNAANGPIDNINDAAAKVATAANLFDYQMAPLLTETQHAMRTLNHTLDNFNQHPQSILFGAAPAQPGPGEAGFTAPARQAED
jgi:phospholipid/cholesterol/gamma-HCH transport system substrate-binding protein